MAGDLTTARLSFLFGYKESRCTRSLKRDSSSLSVVRMTSLVISNVCESSHNRLTWREILQGVAFQNDSYVIPSECEESCYYYLG